MQRLESKGLIQRRRIDDDARMIEIEPTKKTFEMIKQTDHIKKSVEKNIQMNLSKEEINCFITISHRIIEQLENREQEG